MKVIYSCYWGSCLAKVAAFLHLGYICEKDDIAQSLFCDIREYRFGELVFVGRDEMGMDVFAVGSKRAGPVLAKALTGIAKIYGFPSDSVQLVELNHLYNFLIWLGIFLVRKLKLTSWGTKLIALGTKKNFGKLQAAVQNVIAKPIYIENEVNR